jgi:putative hydrolase of the HAD superfamily
MNYVDGGVISYEVKAIKPEPVIYQTLIDNYGINPTEAVFLDDLLINLEGAKPFGFHTIQVKNHEQTLEELRRLGVRI